MFGLADVVTKLQNSRKTNISNDRFELIMWLARIGLKHFSADGDEQTRAQTKHLVTNYGFTSDDTIRVKNNSITAENWSIENANKLPVVNEKYMYVYM